VADFVGNPSINFVEQGISDTVAQVPAEKVINAIPFYTRLWKETPKTEEEIAAEEPTEEAAPPMPDLSDPNKVMSPDEIAALIANTSAGESEPAQEVAKEPANEEIAAEQPTEEAAPAMPDLSDPNKVMSPDEIAALFANLG